MRKRIIFTLFLVICAGASSVLAQGTFTDTYLNYRPYHYQTPQAWNRIRREVATHGKEKWPLMDTRRVEMTLAGGWQGLIPTPTSGNTYFFKEVGDLGRIFGKILEPNAYGYVVYPFKMEEQFELSENEQLSKHILAKGFMNTLVTDVPYETEQKLDEIIYSSDTARTEENTEPEAFDEAGTMGWLKEAEYYDLYNVKNFYCYFDNRPDTVRYNYKYVTRVTESFDEEVAQLKEAMQTSDLFYTLIPYWMTDVYLQLPPSLPSGIHRFGYLGYIINPLSGTPELTNNWTSPNLLDISPYKDKRYDLVAYCGDAPSTNRFLTNREACHRFIHTLFNPPTGMINRPGGTHKPAGLNLYLPVFDFKEKRALTQLVKSLSLVIDSLRVGDDTAHVYRDIDLSLTFSRRAAIEHSGFISGLQCFVDTVYFADFDSLGLASKVIYNNGSVDTSSVFTLVSNPFYLFRIPYKAIQPGVNDNNLWELMECDYASGQWGIFFCVDLALLLLLMALLVLRHVSATFHLYLERYHTLLMLLLITLFIEFIVFFFFLIEALSPQIIFFDLTTGNLTYLLLIALPVLPIPLYFLSIRLNKREQIP